jgi:hypothetical protein
MRYPRRLISLGDDSRCTPSPTGEAFTCYGYQ